MQVRRSQALIVLAVLALAIGAAVFLRARTPDVRYVTAVADRGDVLDVVGATGTLQAVTTVQVGSQVSGTIQSLYADFNSVVKKGEVLARLDPSLLQAHLGQAQAGLVSAQANVERSRATLEDARQKQARAQTLSAEGLLPQADLETARATYSEAAAQLKASQAAVTQAAANVRQAQVDMAHSVISAPIDGVVVSRSVDVGQTVAASLQAPVLFVIANDLRRLQVSASIDEADVGRVRAGQEATFRVDAFPNEVFTGTVDQVRLQPITVQNVVTYTTLIGVNNPGQRLMPGMTATVSVIVDRRDDVVRIPAAALRFRPEGFDPTAAGRAGRGAAASGRPPASGAPGAPPQPGMAGQFAEGREGGRGGRAGGGGGRWRGAGGRGPGGASPSIDPSASPGASPSPGPSPSPGASPSPGGQGRARGGMRPTFVFVPDAAGKPQAVRIRQGITDGQYVEVLDGLQEGQAVITGIVGETTRGAAPRGGASPAAANPFAPAAPQRRSR
jgi:HlyD family secretion protein